MTFSQQALRLSGQCCLLLGWRPAEFWSATPAELAAIAAAMTQGEAQPPDTATLNRLKELFPDG